MSYTNDPAVSVSANGNMSIDTFEMNDQYTGLNDFGQPLYMFDGVEMTAEQAEANAEYFAADDSDYYDDDEYDSLPDTITDQLYRINDALGGEGAADFLADELLGIGDSRMSEVMRATHQSKEEIQSHAHAVMYDLAASFGVDGDSLMDELGKDISTIRGMRSDAGTKELHKAITLAVTGDYHGAMQTWDRLRRAMQSIR